MRPGKYAEQWSRLRIYQDSPLAEHFTQRYRELRPYWDPEALSRVLAGRLPLGFDQSVAVGEHRDHEANVRRIARSGEPAVVIAASGMCAGGGWSITSRRCCTMHGTM
ncbi:hypothetical protein [Nitrogeniibacter aestuarii]|uniref:hypothetical protein n=1 Tax=Nitrogeniibacter aestuarii TaxID=2815343 RepID=UPI001D0FCC6F|nr:hypothetical protein [Nitrogeniibacter aestuarii]